MRWWVNTLTHTRTHARTCTHTHTPILGRLYQRRAGSDASLRLPNLFNQIPASPSCCATFPVFFCYHAAEHSAYSRGQKMTHCLLLTVALTTLTEANQGGQRQLSLRLAAPRMQSLRNWTAEAWLPREATVQLPLPLGGRGEQQDGWRRRNKNLACTNNSQFFSRELGTLLSLARWSMISREGQRWPALLILNIHVCVLCMYRCCLGVICYGEHCFAFTFKVFSTPP